jgi:hypothetical protein
MDVRSRLNADEKVTERVMNHAQLSPDLNLMEGCLERFLLVYMEIPSH